MGKSMKPTLFKLLFAGSTWFVVAAFASAAEGTKANASDASWAASASESWDDWSDEEGKNQESSFEYRGFVEALAGVRTQDNPVIANDMTAEELRLQGELSGYQGSLFTSLKLDFYADQVTEKVSADLREAYVQWPVADQVDLKLGRQVLTWGTGDLLFLNDLFQKDWQGFFAGREMAYLKSPSDAVKLSLYSQAVNVDIVWLPHFREDKYLDGERFSYFSPISGQLTAAPPKIYAREPDEHALSEEVALRLYRQWQGVEYAAYGFHGYYHQPLGYDSVRGLLLFPRLNSVGASARGTLEQIVTNIELAYYDSVDDRNGSNPLLPNSQWRALIGLERELATDFTGSLQFYLEKTGDYDRYKQSLPNAEFANREWRQVYTIRLTQRLDRGNWVNSFFAFYSPSDSDYFFLPAVSYRFSDALHTEVGGRILGGKENHTFYASLEQNSSIYWRWRYNF